MSGRVGSTSPGLVTSTGGSLVVFSSADARRLTHVATATMMQKRVAARRRTRAAMPQRVRNTSSSARRNTSQLLLRLRRHFASRSIRLLALLPLACHLGNSLLDSPRMMHRAELGAAHPAELGALEVFGRQCLVVVFLRALRVEAQTELFLPVERVASARQRVVAIAGALPAAGDVRRMRGDLVGDDSLPDVFGVRESEVLLGGDVAQHVGAEPADHGGTDSAGDVVVA